LADKRLLTSKAARGRYAGRSVRDPSQFLESHTDAVTNVAGAPGLLVGVIWHDPLAMAFL